MKRIKRIKLSPFVKLDKVRKAFYRECLKENLSLADINIIAFGIKVDSHKDVLAGIKASIQRKRNIAGRKAARTRKKNRILAKKK